MAVKIHPWTGGVNRNWAPTFLLGPRQKGPQSHLPLQDKDRSLNPEAPGSPQGLGEDPVTTKLPETKQAARPPLKCPCPSLGPNVSPKTSTSSHPGGRVPGQAGISSHSGPGCLRLKQRHIRTPLQRERGHFQTQRELALICCTVNDNNANNENMVWGRVPGSPTFWYLKEL